MSGRGRNRKPAARYRRMPGHRRHASKASAQRRDPMPQSAPSQSNSFTFRSKPRLHNRRSRSLMVPSRSMRVVASREYGCGTHRKRCTAASTTRRDPGCLITPRVTSELPIRSAWRARRAQMQEGGRSPPRHHWVFARRGAPPRTPSLGRGHHRAAAAALQHARLAGAGNRLEHRDAALGLPA